MIEVKGLGRIFPIPYEKLFVVLGLIFGIVLAFVNPPYHSNDEDRRFYQAYAMSNGRFVPEQGENEYGAPLPKSVYQITASYQAIKFRKGKDTVAISRAKMAETLRKPLNPEDEDFYHIGELKDYPIPAIAPAIGILFGKLFAPNPIKILRFGRIASLLLYLFVVYFAIKIIPIHKAVLFLIALNPTSLFQAASISYDGASNALSFLLFALILKFALHADKKIETKDLILLAAIALLHRFTKNGYFLLPFLFLIIPIKKIGSPIKYGLTLAFFAILIFLPNWTWVAFVRSLDLSGGPELQKDFYFSRATNMSYALSHPFATIGLIFKNLIYQRQEWAAGAFAKFGYSYKTLGTLFYAIHGLVLLAAAFFDSNEKFEFKVRQRVTLIAIALISFFGLIFGFYTDASPVGAELIFGLQGRYFIPLLPPLLATVYNSKFDFEGRRKFGPIVLGAYAVAILTYVAIFINGFYYVD